jgi:hypothetical protein
MELDARQAAHGFFVHALHLIYPQLKTLLHMLCICFFFMLAFACFSIFHLHTFALVIWPYYCGNHIYVICTLLEKQTIARFWLAP